MGPHSFPRVIPDEDAGSLTITRFREDCLVHTAASSCATKGFLSGVSNLDVRLTITVDDGTGDQNVSWSLRDVLMREKVGNKPLFRVIAELDGGEVAVITATGKERDAAVQNICHCTPAWAMYKLLFGHGAKPEHVQQAMTSWFVVTQANAAMEYSEYDIETGQVIMDTSGGQREGREAQELLGEGMVDMSILDKAQVYGGEEVAGRDYDSDNSAMSRGSQNTTLFAARIYGFDAAVAKVATQKQKQSPGGPSNEGTPGPAHGGDTAAETAGAATGPPLPPPSAGREAGAMTE